MWIQHEVGKGQPDLRTLRTWLLAPPFADALMGQRAQADWAYVLATQNKAETLVKDLTQRLEETPGSLPPLFLDRLKGTVAYNAGDHGAAEEPLKRAAAAVPVSADPALHARLADVLSGEGRTGGCEAWERLVREHPKYPRGVESLRRACGGKSSAVMSRLTTKQRQRLLDRRLGGASLTSMSVNDAAGGETTLRFGRRRQAHPLGYSSPPGAPIAGARWRPSTLWPSVSKAGAAMRGRRRFVAIRTSIERESQDFASFEAEFAPAFSIYSDLALSLGFTKVANDLGLTPALPTMLLIGAGGQVEYLVEMGTHRDLVRDVLWMVESL